MQGIQRLHIDIRKYSGEINILSDKPQIHLILSADTQFLDCAFSALERNPDHFAFNEKAKGKIKISFLRKQDSLVDGLTVAENLFLPNRQGVFLSKRRMAETCERLFEEIGYYLPPSAPVSELTGSQRKFVEFYQVYLHQPDALVANEVTASLSYKEIGYFSRIVEKLKERGTSVYFFTTRYEEALRIGDVYHVFVDGEQRRAMTKQEVQEKPEALFLSMMNMADAESDDGDTERQWLRAINDSLQIDNQLLRVNMVLSAYCTRICKIVGGQFCRLYIYQGRDGEITCVSSSEEGRPGFGHLKEEYLKSIITGSPLFFSTERDHDYAALFEAGEYPQGTMCYSMTAAGENRLMIQVGMASPPKYISSDKLDQIQHIAIELLIFIENSQLHRQTAILQESNHRIKNNMQMILSYLLLQQQALLKSMTDEEDRARVDQAFSDLTNRIMAVYNVHNLISDFGMQIRTASLRELVEETKKVYASRLEVSLQAEDADIPQKMLMPLCIILNELMNNTVKHNAELGRPLRAEVCAVREGNMMRFTYRDNGAGADAPKPAGSSGIGLRLITTLVQNDLRGEITTEAGHGYTAEIRFPLVTSDKK